MPDVMDDTGARVENALSLAILLAVSAVAVFVAATSFGAASPQGPRSTAPGYPVRIALTWPNALGGGRPSAGEPRATGIRETARSDPLSQVASQNDGDSQPTLASNGPAAPDTMAQDSAPGKPQTAGRSTGGTPFLVSDFNLGSGPSASSAIEIRKPVLVNGRAAGTIRLRIDAAAQVYVRAEDIAKLLAGKVALPKGADQDFIALDQIRDRGIDIRYNAGQDALVITN